MLALPPLWPVRHAGAGQAIRDPRRQPAFILLLFRERRQYLRAVEEALAGAEAARVVLEGVVRRMGGR